MMVPREPPLLVRLAKVTGPGPPAPFSMGAPKGLLADAKALAGEVAAAACSARGRSLRPDSMSNGSAAAGAPLLPARAAPKVQASRGVEAAGSPEPLPPADRAGAMPNDSFCRSKMKDR